MKIVKPGVTPKPPADPWPLGKDLTCRACRCAFQLARGDRFSQTTERRPGGMSTVDVACPHCKAPLSFSRPISRPRGAR